MGWQGHRHPTIKSGPMGQGSSAVTMVPGDTWHMSVIPQVLLELPLSTGPPSIPFFLWLLPSDIAAWAPRGPGLGPLCSW